MKHLLKTSIKISLILSSSIAFSAENNEPPNPENSYLDAVAQLDSLSNDNKNDIKLSEGLWQLSYINKSGELQTDSFTLDQFNLYNNESVRVSGKMHGSGNSISCEVPAKILDQIILADLFCTSKDIGGYYHAYAFTYDPNTGQILDGYVGEGEISSIAITELADKSRSIAAGENYNLSGGTPVVIEEETAPDSSPIASCGVVYNDEFGSFKVPGLLYDGIEYDVTFKNVGNFIFRVDGYELH
jgi:hypothetical protein